MRSIVSWTVLGAFVLAACAGSGSETPSPRPQASPDRAASAASTASAEGARPSASPEPATIRPVGSEPLRLVALGDAYTAGTGTAVPKRESWPQQLVRAMRNDVRLRLTANLADLGKGSHDVIQEQLWQLESLRPDVVTLLIGVNDIIATDVSLEDYERNVATILDALLAELPPSRIFVITTPDHTLTLRGGDYGEREENRRAVVRANALLTSVAQERGIAVVDISPVSDRVSVDPTLVASDGLHPSAKQYAGWVELIAPRMEQVLLGREP